MLAEVVLRPPDVRHLDAAFQGLAASPRRESSLKVSIGDLFATRCATCSRSLVIDEIIWAVDDEAAIAGRIRPVTRHYRCAVCRDQRGGTEQRQAPLDADDLRRATAEVGAAAMRSSLLARFPEIPGAETLPDELLDLHTDRQLVGLGAILERIEIDLRAAPVMAALRLALLHAILPASRLGTGPGRRTTLRVASGHVRPLVRHAVPRAQPMARLRGCVPDGPRVHPAPGRRRARPGPGAARRGPAEPRRRRGDRLRRPDRPDRVRRPARRPERLRPDGADAADPADPRPAADAPEPRAPRGRLSRDVVGPRPGGGRAAAARRARRRVAARAVGGPGDLDGGGPRGGRTGVRPGRPGRLARRRRSGGDRGDRPRRGLGGLPAARRAPGRPGRRCAGRRRADPARRAGCRRGRGRAPTSGSSRCRAGPATRAWSRRAACSRRRRGSTSKPFSAAETARVVTEAAVETLRARGEPARFERLLGEILVGLDRSGQLRRFATATLRPGERGSGRAPTTRARRPRGTGRGPPQPSARRRPGPTPADADGTPATGDGAAGPAPRTRRGAADRDAPTDAVERLLALIRDEFGRPTQRRLTEVEPGRWWLADADDLAAAATPLADRVEWAVYSLLSTAGPISETAFFERMATMFNGPDLADAGLDPGGPRELSQPGQHARPDGHGRRPAAPQPGAHGPARDDRRRRPPPRHAPLDRPARADPAAGDRRAPRRPPRARRGAALPRRDRAGRGRRRRGRCDLVRPRQGRLPVRGRVDRDAGRDRCCDGTPGSRRATT